MNEDEFRSCVILALITISALLWVLVKITVQTRTVIVTLENKHEPVFTKPD